MKKFNKIILILLLSILLTGCKEKRISCKKATMENGTINDEIVEVIFKRNKPNILNISNKIMFNSNSNIMITNKYESLYKTFKIYENKKGINFFINKDKNSINYVFNIELNKIENSKNLKIKLSKNDNLNKIKKIFTNDGYNCD